MIYDSQTRKYDVVILGAGAAFYGDVVTNITKLVGDLGSNGLTGLLSLAVILYLFKR